MEFFAGYGFNKSHSTTYALGRVSDRAISRRTIPRHFMAALLTIEAANTDKLAMYLGECRDLGVPILPPDINASELPFTVEPEGVRFGLVRDQERRRRRDPVDARRAQGAWAASTSLYTLCEQVDLRLVNKRRAREPDQGRRVRLRWPDRACRRRSRRARLFAAVDRAIEHGSRHQRDREKGQHQLFGDSAEDGPAVAMPLPDAAGVDRDPAARLREGSARPLHERPSARALRRATEERSAPSASPS